jgi:methylamine dehydrogenase heavy chain
VRTHEESEVPRVGGRARVSARAIVPVALVAAVATAAIVATRGDVAVAAPEPVGEPVGQVLTLPEKPGPHWFWVSDVLLHRTALYDGDGGKMLGSITAGSPGVGFVISPMFSPDRRDIYIPESYFSRGIRGDRTDVVTVYDARTLMPREEIAIPPKRAEYFPGVAANALSDDGRYIAVFNVTPAQSLTVVDAPGRRLIGEVTTPGCSLVYPAGPSRFFMLCADGAALLVDVPEDGSLPIAKRTSKFFDADKDPLADQGVRRGNEWIFTSFDGMVQAIDVAGDAPKFAEPWSLLDDADRKDEWRPGGGQQVAIHVASNRLFVLMHQGGVDTHKQAGTEVWVYDLESHRRLQRIAVNSPLATFIRGQARLGKESYSDRIVSWLLDTLLPNLGAESILVTQDASPVLVTLSLIPPAVSVHDATTGEVRHEIGDPGLAGTILVAAH